MNSGKLWTIDCDDVDYPRQVSLAGLRHWGRAGYDVLDAANVNSLSNYAAVLCMWLTILR